MPAVDANSDVVANVYDFAVYTTQAIQPGRASLTRALFTSRTDTGAPIVAGEGSARRPETEMLVEDLLIPNGTVAPVFALDQSIIDMARQVVLSVTLQGTEATYLRRDLSQTYTARFRLRNS